MNKEEIKLPPMLEYIKTGNINAVRTLLDKGMPPNTQLHYKYIFLGDKLEATATPIEFAITNGQLEIVELLVERGAELNPIGESLLYLPLNFNYPSIFAYLVEQGARINNNQKEISRLFLNMDKCDFPDIMPTVKKMNLPLSAFGGEPLRSAAGHGNISMVQFLLDEGADINYHVSDMIYPYASTPITEAARENNFEMVKCLAERGADITITDKYGDRPYTLAVKNKNPEMAEYLKNLEPKDFHNEQEKIKILKTYKLPKGLADHLKSGQLKLEFPNGRLIKWAKLYSYMDTVEIKWKRKKLLSILEALDNYSDLMLVWYPKDARLWCIDIEHEEFNPLCTWDEFIADPEKYLNRMIEGQFEE